MDQVVIEHFYEISITFSKVDFQDYDTIALAKVTCDGSGSIYIVP